MPSYDYSCDKCGVNEYVHGMNDEMKCCPNCGGEIKKCFNFRAEVQGSYDYWDEHLGSFIHSREQRKQLMKQRGLADGSPDDSPRLVKQKKEQAEKLKVSVSTLEHMYERQRVTRPQRREDVRF